MSWPSWLILEPAMFWPSWSREVDDGAGLMRELAMSWPSGWSTWTQGRPRAPVLAWDTAGPCRSTAAKTQNVTPCGGEKGD